MHSVGYRGNLDDVTHLVKAIFHGNSVVKYANAEAGIDEITKNGLHHAMKTIADALYAVSQASVLPRPGQTAFPFAALRFNPLGLASGLFFILPICPTMDSTFAAIGLIGVFTFETGFGIALTIVAGAYGIIRPWIIC